MNSVAANNLVGEMLSTKNHPDRFVMVCYDREKVWPGGADCTGWRETDITRM